MKGDHYGYKDGYEPAISHEEPLYIEDEYELGYNKVGLLPKMSCLSVGWLTDWLVCLS